jgi:hypothetical protein
MPWRDPISRPIDPFSSVADGDNTATYIDHAARASCNLLMIIQSYWDVHIWYESTDSINS